MAATTAIRTLWRRPVHGLRSICLGRYYQNKGIRTLEHMKIHMRLEKSIFDTYYELACSVEYLIGPDAIEGRVTDPYYRNFVETELPLHLENMPLAARWPISLQHE
jgi:hypothetical protein